MPPMQRGAPHDGRLNLEQQKKRAKELLRAFDSAEGDARARFALHQPRVPAPRLADAQFVIARENGFETWPKLKAHAEALALARAAMKGDAPDSAGTLHIRCGTDIEDALRKAGFVGAFHEFSDPFCQGPVLDLPRADFIAARAAFIGAAYDLFPHIARERLEAAYAVFDRVAAFEEIVLWFEHDSYDQLILAYLLKQLGEMPAAPPISLICVDHVPGVSRFVGLGQLSAEVVRWLWSLRRPIGAADFAFGAQVFAALSAESPQALQAFAAKGTSPIAPMAGALMRHLQELPAVRNGLGLTQQMALDVIAAHGPCDSRAVFKHYSEREPLPFLGDLMFWDVLAELADAAQPAINAQSTEDHGRWPRRRMSLTETGRRLRAGEIDWLDCGPRPRFVGGVEIAPGKPAWRFDDQTNAVQLI